MILTSAELALAKLAVDAYGPVRENARTKAELLVKLEAETDELRVVAAITSGDTHDPDGVPLYSKGNCRHWGAWDDSPVIPNERCFVVFNREPTDEDEAAAVAKAYLNPD